MAKRKVITTVAMWQEPVEGTSPQQYTQHSAMQGAEIDVTGDALKWLEEQGAVATLADADAAAAALRAEDEPVPAGEEGDALLSSWKAGELIAYVTQYPGEAERVYGLEVAKGTDDDGKPKGYATVAKAAGFDLATGDRIETNPV